MVKMHDPWGYNPFFLAFPWVPWRSGKPVMGSGNSLSILGFKKPPPAARQGQQEIPLCWTIQLDVTNKNAGSNPQK
jgi:hypothetical protein